MLLIFVIPFLLILGLLAYSDVRTRQLADVHLALLWLLPGLILLESLQGAVTAYTVAGGAFALAYAGAYAIPAFFLKKPFLRSGDIVILPPVLAFAFTVAGYLGADMVLLALGFSLIVSYKKELPFAAILFGVALICASLGLL